MTDCGCPADQADTLERRTLRTLLAINGVMFVAEAGLGWWAESTALLADSLDMLADAAVYGLSLRAVGGSGRRRSRAATFSGVLQMVLGAGVLLEVGRRFLSGSDPVSTLMMAVGAVALAANLSCLALLAKHRGGGVHMRASWIFSTNDVIANVGVILSGALVLWTGSRWPDLIVGAVVAVVVLWGGVRILREAWPKEENP
ncbi:cation diffusion facilitator family transporter [Alienimonas californiensis]|uniref:Cadmium, cobalt and zinc/H(+)-K(+) antiporter n=1 Tax=Alienimonas californiensis TaxID=2527989 RepID=A0A517PB12_9PLAN|nr:cation diffusion facilitator family transporter [Alienimonas californiensis]QDT16567.1 Cadmium, cobalt and zinc/H(+)-K(+) antiporter [Alienimonas californiensis]